MYFMKKSDYKKAVIVPMYNERENISLFCQALLSVGDDFVVILSIYPSSDGTQKIAETLVQESKRLIIVVPQKMDLGEAYRKGFKKALDLGADQIITMDGDFSHDPQDLPRLFKEGKNYDLVVGSRYVLGGKITTWFWGRRIMSRTACALNSLILGLKVKDSTGGFRCYSRALAVHLLSRSFITRGFAFQVEAFARTERGDYRVCEIPIVFHKREKGTSKLSIGNIKRYFIDIFRLRRKL